MASLLTTQGLSKNFGQTRALHDVSLTIEAGKVYTVLGENGSGKSTLVKVLSGILPADRGTLRVDGNTITPSGPADMIAAGVTVVLQEVLVAHNRCGLDNVEIGRNSLWSFRGAHRQRREKIESLVNSLSARPIDLDAPAGNLPLNEQQVLVIARGFLAQPKILILDEVTAALDLTDRDKLFQALRAFCADGGAVLFISHRMPEIIDISDEVLMMQNGRNTGRFCARDITATNLLAHLAQEAHDG